MYYIYIRYAQNLIQLSILPTNIKFNEINLSISFNEPDFKYLLDRDNLLMFEIYLHNDYYKSEYKYKKEYKEVTKMGHCYNFFKCIVKF